MAATLPAKRSAGVALQVNLREPVTCMPPPSANKAEPTLALKPRGDCRTMERQQGWFFKLKRVRLFREVTEALPVSGLIAK